MGNLKKKLTGKRSKPKTFDASRPFGSISQVNLMSDQEEKKKKAADYDTRPCSGLRVDLKRCLLLTECCTVRKKTPLVCLNEGDVPQECQALRVAFFECKRSVLDMRTRFRGRKGY